MNYKKRIYEYLISDFAHLFKIVFLVGSCQVGKSSILSHLFPDVKVIVFDPVQDFYHVRKDPDLFLGDFGKPFFESYCFNMIKAFCGALPMMPNFYHWRTLAGAEVDFIVEIDGRFYPIEVKTASTVSKNDVRGINAFRDTYPHLNIAMGVVIYAGNDCYLVSENIVAVPWNLK